MQKKIAFIIRLFQDKSFHGGGEKLFYKLISKMIRNKYVIDIYCSETNVSEFPGINQIIVVDKPYCHIDPVSMEEFYNEAKKLIKDKEYDFIISENVTPPVDITFIHGHSMIYRQKKLRNIFQRFFSFNIRPVKSKRIKYEKKWLSQGYRKIFVVSNILKNDYIENFGIPESVISVLYPGVDIPDNTNFSPSLNKTFTFGLSSPGFVRKGGYIFLKALVILKKRGVDFKAKVIYPGFKKNLWLKILIKLYGIDKNIEFCSFQNSMQDFYENIDCMIMPSVEEAFGLVALEAMANKKVSIVSSLSGASEIIQDGVNGFIFNMDKNSAKNLAEKMLYLIKNKDNLKDYNKKAFETAKIYNWDLFYNNFINELLKLG